jgi:hypothetical protein
MTGPTRWDLGAHEVVASRVRNLASVRPRPLAIPLNNCFVAHRNSVGWVIFVSGQAIFFLARLKSNDSPETLRLMK